MAALLLRRALVASASPLSTQHPLLPRAIKSSSSFLLRSPLFASRFLQVSTNSSNDHPALIQSIIENGVPFPHDRVQVLLPIPEGFPFRIVNTLDMLKLIRLDKDEKFQVNVDLKSYQLLNGYPCYTMYTTIDRGYWRLQLKIIAGPKTLKIMFAKMSGGRNSRLQCFDKFLDTKGIHKGMIRGLLGLFRKTAPKE